MEPAHRPPPLVENRYPMTDAQDRCRGVLIGLAAGDLIGGPVRMAVRLAESLSDLDTFDPADVFGRYLGWWREGAFDTGPVADSVLALVAAGVPIRAATERVHRETGGRTAGCNPAHRAAPLAMSAGIADADLAACAMAEAGLTHHDPLAGEVSAAVTTLCRALIRGAEWDRAVQAAGGFGGDIPDDTGGYAPEVYRAAVYFVGTSAGFAEALERSVGFAGASNYCPVLAGAIGGARWGAAAVPLTALAHVGVLLPRVRAVADALAAGWAAEGC